ncbi:MAG: hypothetical protein M0P64_03575 [Candidatus Pacebacteria bacterium]|jgi:hypothetical protein|nr:hypothetical protein [Candidatus Paceibacterota bacterium]
MSKNETIKFSGYHLIIKGKKTFDLSCFSLVESERTERLVISSGEQKETLQVTKHKKVTHSERFLTLYFNSGEKYPYSPTVIDGELQETDNPRNPEQIELDEQLFVLFDTVTQRMWISNQRKKNFIVEWIAKKTKFEISVKSILDEETFLEKIKSVEEVSFCVVPNLFNTSGQNTLSGHLAQDIYGFGASKARIELSYKDISINDKIKTRIREMLGRKSDFQDVSVVGRSDEGLDTIFNLEEVISRIHVEVVADNKSKLLDPVEVFDSLISNINKYE